MSPPFTSSIKSAQHAIAMLFASLRRRGFLLRFRNMRQEKKFGSIASSGHPGRSILRSREIGTMLGRGDDSTTKCKECRFASTVSIDVGHLGETKDCDGCGGSGTFGPARNWLRPPGFAHPVDTDEGTSPDDQPARSYATRAKLTMPTPADPDGWLKEPSSPCLQYQAPLTRNESWAARRGL